MSPGVGVESMRSVVGRSLLSSTFQGFDSFIELLSQATGGGDHAFNGTSTRLGVWSSIPVAWDRGSTKLSKPRMS